MKVLVTCPPMLHNLEEFRPRFERQGIDVDAPAVVQTLTEAELVRRIPNCHGWIIGDDPATRAVFAAGKAGVLKAAVKWGVGVDNVDFTAARELGIVVANTPQMFGREVADVAMSYVTALARDLVTVDREVRGGRWPKPSGISLAGRTVALIGYGDIGRQTARRLLAADMRVIAYDPALDRLSPHDSIETARWPERIEEADFVVLTCALTVDNRHMLNRGILARSRRGVRVVNVARGPLIDESALAQALESHQVSAAALDVFEKEPLPPDSPLRQCERCILGSHNASNTVDAVRRASERAIDLLFDFLGVS
ncbi:MAG: phosphoglycerate dehydrogenase [Vicinamibacterales bacterium]